MTKFSTLKAQFVKAQAELELIKARAERELKFFTSIVKTSRDQAQQSSARLDTLQP